MVFGFGGGSRRRDGDGEAKRLAARETELLAQLEQVRGRRVESAARRQTGAVLKASFASCGLRGLHAASARPLGAQGVRGGDRTGGRLAAERTVALPLTR